MYHHILIPDPEEVHHARRHASAGLPDHAISISPIQGRRPTTMLRWLLTDLVHLPAFGGVRLLVRINRHYCGIDAAN